MTQLPIMIPFELSLENELNVEVERFNNNWLFKWHGMTYEGGQTDVEDFRGGRIHYSGVRFEYQQRQVFWHAINCYLNRKFHETFKQWDVDTRSLANEIRLKSIDGIDRTLRRFVGRIVAHGRETDQRLRSGIRSVESSDGTIANVYTMAEISNLAASHRMLLQHAIASSKAIGTPKIPNWKWFEQLYSENRGLIWLVGGLASGGTIVAGYLLH